MKPSSGQPDKLGETAVPYSAGEFLELPVDPGFVSEPPRMTVEQMYAFNMERMKSINTNPRIMEEWLRDKYDAPFEL